MLEKFVRLQFLSQKRINGKFCTSMDEFKGKVGNIFVGSFLWSLWSADHNTQLVFRVASFINGAIYN